MISRPTGPMTPKPGRTLSPGTMLASRYQIEKVIGSGGMSMVYLARDRRFRTTVRYCAVKEMFDAILDAEARRRARETFEREANLLASLSHHAIPKVYDYFTESERHYLVYEYIEGQDLARLLQQRARPMPPEKVVDWSVQLARVLTMLHAGEPPIIFRDLKPSNVMLRNDGQIVLIDFGIAKQFQPVKKGTMIGTEGYAPPEQYEGQASPQVDIYSLGATMHQLLTNTDPQEFRPFSFDQRPISKYNPKVTHELSTIVMRALAYEPKDRWESMRALRVALEGVQRQLVDARLDSGPAVPFTPDRGSHPLPPNRRGSGLFERLHGEGTRPMSREDDPSAHTPPPAGTRPVSRGDSGTRPVHERPSASTGRVSEPAPAAGATQSMAPAPPYASAPPPSEPTITYGGRVGDAGIVPLWTFATEDEVRSTPALTEDALYVGSYDTNLYCLDRKTGEFRWKYATNGGVPGTPTIWQEMVIVGSEDQSVYGLNRRTGRVEWTSQTQGRVRSSPSIAVDHVYIGSDDGFVYAFGARRGHLIWRTHVGAPVRSTAAIGEKLLFIGNEEGAVAGIDLLTGEVVWRVRTNGAVIGSPTITADRVIAGSMDRQLYGIDQSSGWVVWRVKMSDQVYAAPLLVDDRIYVCAVDGTLYCLDSDWGREVWKISLGTQVTSSPIADLDDTLYVGGRDGALYSVNMRKGRVQWRFQTGGPIPGSPRTAEGVVYFGSMDYRVYAIPTQPAPPSF